MRSDVSSLILIGITGSSIYFVIYCMKGLIRCISCIIACMLVTAMVTYVFCNDFAVHLEFMNETQYTQFCEYDPQFSLE